MNSTVKNTEYSTWEAPNPSWTPIFKEVPWLNIPPVDYNLLKNKP